MSVEVGELLDLQRDGPDESIFEEAVRVVLPPSKELFGELDPPDLALFIHGKDAYGPVIGDIKDLGLSHLRFVDIINEPNVLIRGEVPHGDVASLESCDQVCSLRSDLYARNPLGISEFFFFILLTLLVVFTYLLS